MPGYFNGGACGPFKKAGRAAGAIELILLASDPCLCTFQLAVLDLSFSLSTSFMINKIQQGNEP